MEGRECRVSECHSTRAKINQVLDPMEGKGRGDIDKVLGPPLPLVYLCTSTSEKFLILIINLD